MWLLNRPLKNAPLGTVPNGGVPNGGETAPLGTVPNGDIPNGDKTVSLFERLIRLIYPVKCMCCGDILKEDSTLYLCDKCHKLLPRCEGRFYRSCKVPYIDGLFCGFNYESGIDKAIQSMKFKNQPKLSETLSYILMEEFFSQPLIFNFDMIIPVPMHRKKRRQRGYNQSELVAGIISKYINVPLNTKVLIKSRDTKPQSSLKRQERLSNLDGVFRVVNPSNIRGKNILLIDDVITTGTTINTCGKILYEHHAGRIYAMVIANAEK